MLVTTGPTTRSSDNAALESAVLPLVHVVEDETGILALFRNMGRMSGFDVVDYPSKQAFLDAFDAARPGCIVLDLNLPDGTGIEILEHLTTQACCMPVIFMSGMAKVSEAVTAFRLGSIDFVEKPFDLEIMLEAIGRAVATDVQRRNSSANHDEIANHFAKLTPRENEVMELVVQGAPNKEIAVRMGLSPKTVEVHRASVMRKTAATSVAELVRMHIALTSS